MLNIVTPEGTVLQESAPFTLVGNRNAIHEGNRIIKTHSGTDWIYCVTSALEDPREFMGPTSFTELFFLDEATALAAGHRPCYRCNRQRFDEFFAAWSSFFHVEKPTIKDVDPELHRHRIDDEGRQVTYRSEAADLPSGTMIRSEECPQPLLVRKGAAYPWTSHGYGIKIAMPRNEVTVLTPRPIVDLMKDGFEVGPTHPLLAW